VDRTTQNLLLKFALIGGAAYVIYTLLTKAGGAVTGALSQATSGTSTLLANAYVALTSQGAQIPQGQILLPDGQTFVPVSSVSVSNVSGTNYGTFNYQGTQYYLLTGHDSNGNYQAYATING
jgi:hypothetical protein